MMKVRSNLLHMQGLYHTGEEQRKNGFFLFLNTEERGSYLFPSLKGGSETVFLETKWKGLLPTPAFLNINASFQEPDMSLTLKWPRNVSKVPGLIFPWNVTFTSRVIILEFYHHFYSYKFLSQGLLLMRSQVFHNIYL